MQKGGKQTLNAFTLIELAIVLVIISLIVGGIIGGKSLIDAQRTRSVITEFSTFDAAFTNFFNQYDAYAGDMSDASDYWAGAEEGNGDNTYDADIGDGYKAWQHLTLAELIPGSYSGEVLGGPTTGMDLDIEAPRAEYYDGAGWLASDQNITFTDSTKYLRIGEANAASNGNFADAVMGKHARQIDKKLDDGLSNSGVIRAHDAWSGNGLCYSGSAYNLTATELECALYFKLTVQ